jgi:hypothetical protein
LEPPVARRNTHEGPPAWPFKRERRRSARPGEEAGAGEATRPLLTVDALLPPHLHRQLEGPRLTRGALKELQLMLVQRIGELEELFKRG